MVRRNHRMERLHLRSPHPRGDGPSKAVVEMQDGLFSPPAWGWSARGDRGKHRPAVLPTRVGMVRGTFIGSPLGFCSPHPRGDGPAIAGRRARYLAFSPPAWGWSEPGSRHRENDPVLPTRVGMVRVSRWRSNDFRSSPHPRGDGPRPAGRTSWKRWFSPPAWGWSV